MVKINYLDIYFICYHYEQMYLKDPHEETRHIYFTSFIGG